MSSKLYCFAAAVCLCGLALGIYAPVVADQPYAYDEADYMWAGKQGLWANYTDRNALSFVDFVEKGLQLSRDSSQRQSFSEYIRNVGDIGFFRHYHGPMYAYWLALWQDAGAVRENVFRGSGLALQFASALLILFGMWRVFPSLPPVAGLVACALFIFNRTALTGATSITQHVLFTFFAITTLFSASLFFEKLETRWFYLTAISLALAFCTVETSSLMVGGLVLALVVEHRRIRQKWPTIKAISALVGKALGLMVLTVLVCWPKGIVQLGIGKGFLTLAYMSIVRKNFSPMGTLGLWKARYTASPWEFTLLVAGMVAAFFLWRRFKERSRLLSWLAFIVMFFVATLRLTLEYVYYYAPLTAALTVVTGVAFGILWARWSWPGKVALTLAVTASIVAMTVQYHGILREAHDGDNFRTAAVKAVGDFPPQRGQTLYLPFQLVPTLHYYHPEVKTVGYDVDYPIARLADGVTSAQAAGTMMCEEDFCAALDRQAPGFAEQKTLLDAAGPYGHPLYLIRVRKSGSL